MTNEVTLTKLKAKLINAKMIDGTTNYTIAAECGMHPTQLSRYAAGKDRIQPRHLRALCRYFECSQHELLGTRTFDMDYR